MVFLMLTAQGKIFRHSMRRAIILRMSDDQLNWRSNVVVHGPACPKAEWEARWRKRGLWESHALATDKKGRHAPGAYDAGDAAHTKGGTRPPHRD